jgi:hypothetical protein
LASPLTGQRKLADNLEQRNWREKYQHINNQIFSTEHFFKEEENILFPKLVAW